eukprot:CAMPEP_0181187470 /NCGR_PEP_ID=MMETSP1096-20121128/10589_1 /TAXON_ID=156174 ORGANISM="Chrysochromulina ericina, Strain CCMP281" /NCGR_SAMPLE_ID=MMETSP1096 /ASSEMBLY_ACC=CAM_ASM_000453 /LENGTH=80 /DNA_ID=CAMNT_0023276445 /DNA_START=917 /DNA_END=1156 /DNA_ORIENTATION=-
MCGTRRHEIVICCALNGSFSHGVCRDVSADAPSLQGGSSIVKLRVVVELADDMWAVASVKRLAQQPVRRDRVIVDCVDWL